MDVFDELKELDRQDRTSCRDYEALYHSLKNVACRVIASTPVASEMEPEELVDAVQLHLREWPKQGSRPFHQLFRVARNVAQTISRASLSRRRREQEVARTNRVEANPSREMEQRELRQLLWEIVAELSAPHKFVITEHLRRSRTLVELAKEEGVPPATMRTRYFTAVKRLRDKLSAANLCADDFLLLISP